jgi:hypothetical protein
MIINLDKEIQDAIKTNNTDSTARGIHRAKHAVLFVISVLDNGGPEDKFSEELFNNLLIELRRCERLIGEHNA